MRAAAARFFNALWYESGHLYWLLWPLSLIYCAAVAIRSTLYSRRVLEAQQVGIPVIVVGNLTVGGTGKTPVVIWLAAALGRRGFSVGIVCRGYGGAAGEWPQIVSADSDPGLVGDEAVLLAARTRCPVAAGPDRVAAARALMAECSLDVIVADDGLQHYRLRRTLELAVVDGRRGLGNRLCLPAGPLREPPRRLARVDAIIVNGGTWGHSGVFRVAMKPRFLRQLATGRQVPLATFKGRHVHAVAAIGHPERFFESLEDSGLIVEPHALADHAAISAGDLQFEEPDEPVIMTEKDAVKCRHIPEERLWCLVADLEFRANDDERLMRLIVRGLEHEN